MSRYKRIVVLTGAGISAESGIATFRDRDGIWARVDLMDVATPQGFQRNPRLVLDFYNRRRRDNRDAKPNEGHLALARLEAEHAANGSVLVVTQNIDLLHEAAGTRSLIHMHGQADRSLCNHCQARHPWGEEDLGVDQACAACGKAGGLRPDVVWFGEMPYHMERIYQELARADLFLSIGTSGNVYPASNFVAEARRAGAHAVELNLEPSEGASLFHEAHHGPASRVVPMYVERILKGEA
jgi:NAD-dependent deacetylase